MLKRYLLGGFRLLADEAPLTALNTPRLQALLAYLALHRHAAHPRSYLAFLFWPDSTEAQARTNLRCLIHQLRQALPSLSSISTPATVRYSGGPMLPLAWMWPSSSRSSLRLTGPSRPVTRLKCDQF